MCLKPTKEVHSGSTQILSQTAVWIQAGVKVER